MPNDAAFRWALVWLAAIVVVIGLYTHSWNKMMATYLLGMLGIMGVLLPDWDFFDRPFSHWNSPVSSVDHHRHGIAAPNSAPTPKPPTRFRMYPVRLVVYTLVYGFGFYKWWMFISN
ncbi:hypothetical protein RHSIM_Rhsim06G0081800 [Rhododendron simsii]|uniref:Signal peptidase complex-like protein DTM1 n=1 Tax=Rhododendron simsii TaxID=118357 RepID=A0A834LLT8_RHOSS|nr:hypothetical protein RHSIM_Rhsim06G0081800 [Rhododendron simsii]